MLALVFRNFFYFFIIQNFIVINVGKVPSGKKNAADTHADPKANPRIAIFLLPYIWNA